MYYDDVSVVAGAESTTQYQAGLWRSAIRAAAWVCAIFGIILLIATAWMSDDAYITLRTIDNFWNGYGLRWNVMERVQVYTHPLWLMVIGAIYGLTREPFFTTLAVSTAIAIASAAVGAVLIARGPAAALAVLVLLINSKAFVEFSTSGLENPLTHLLLALSFWQYVSAPDPRARVRRVSWLAGLCALNRLDTLILTGPMLLRSFWTARSLRSAVAVVIGFLPLLAWMAFALFYYGFAFPNTAYAKLSHGISRSELIPQGFLYLRDSLLADPITLPIIVIAIVMAFRKRNLDAWAIGASLVGSLLYTINVGGDFMTGRFLSAPYLLAVLTLCRGVPFSSLDWDSWAAGAGASAGTGARRVPMVLPIAIVLALISVALPQSPWRLWARPTVAYGGTTHGHGIVDEREFYYPETGLLPVLASGRSDRAGSSQLGRRLSPLPQVKAFHSVGMVGYYGGPGLHVIDFNALTDAFLARLPATPPWRIGHFERRMPAGYQATVENCLSLTFPHAAVAVPQTPCISSPSYRNAIDDPKLAALYDRLALLTQAPLMDRGRLQTLLMLAGTPQERFGGLANAANAAKKTSSGHSSGVRIR